LDSSPDTNPWSSLCCPVCSGRLEPADPIVCNACGARFPRLDGVPCLVVDPDAFLGEWRHRLRAFTTELEVQSSRYRAALDDGARSAAARSRLKLLSTACSDHARRLCALLSPLDAEAPTIAVETYRALGASLPAGQGLTSYYANLHRDWCWGQAENAAALRIVDAALGEGEVGRLLVLGAGAGRLAYDIHVQRRPTYSITADLNPLMALVAHRLYEGGSVELYEFPVAPRDLASHALLRHLGAPAPAPPGLHVVLADAGCAPFAAGSFDTVLTPWLIDILDEDLAVFAQRMAGWLRPGGRWVNSGSLNFQNAQAAACYSVDELPEILAAAGFAELRLGEETMPYLASPVSRHARQEGIVTFSAIRDSSPVPAPARRAQPDWLAHADRPVPLTRELESHVLSMRVLSYVASLVDGRRSVRDIAAVLVKERLMTEAEAEAAVRGFVGRLLDDAQSATRN
jgi:hypothetical protein